MIHIEIEIYWRKIWEAIKTGNGTEVAGKYNVEGTVEEWAITAFVIVAVLWMLGMAVSGALSS
jgi:hypothetical protein